MRERKKNNEGALEDSESTCALISVIVRLNRSTETQFWVSVSLLSSSSQSFGVLIVRSRNDRRWLLLEDGGQQEGAF